MTVSGESIMRASWSAWAAAKTVRFFGGLRCGCAIVLQIGINAALGHGGIDRWQAISAGGHSIASALIGV